MARKILIAEDDRDIPELLMAVLKPAGYSVTVDADGTRLFERICSERPDLIILDIMLPGIDGYSLMMQMAQDATVNTIPVVVLTALSSAAGMFDKFPQVKAFVPKPFEPKYVLELVRGLMAY